MSGAVLPLAAAGLRGRRKAGLVATFVVLVLAAMGIAAGLVVSRQGAPLLDEVAADADVAHLVLFGQPDALAAVAADPEVRAWSGPFASVGGAELLLEGGQEEMAVMALDDRDIAVNRPAMREGRWAAAAGEIVLDRSLAADVGVDVGESVDLRLGSTTAPFAVVGTAVNLTDCFFPQCDPGRAWVTTAGLARLDPREDAFAQAWLRFDDPAQADPFVQRQAAAGVEGITGSESWLDTRDDFLALDRILGAFVTAFGLFVLAVSAVVVVGSMAVRMIARRREIGLMGAVGCTPRQVALALLAEHLVVGVAASLAGWFLAGLIAPSLQLGIGATLGAQSPTWTFSALVVTTLVVSLILAVATLVPALSSARRPVTDVIRDVPPERVSRLSRRVAGLPARLPMLGVRELASRPTRGVLAALAIVVAIVGTLVSLGFVRAVDAVAADPARIGDPWDVTVATGDLPAGEAEAVLAQTDGVEAWYSEVGRRSTLRDGAFLSVAVGGDPADALFRIAGGRSMTAAGEGIAGHGFLERFDVSVGDEVRILAGTTPVTVQVVGWYRETEDSGEVLQYRLETLAAAEPGVVPDVYRIVASEGTTPEELATRLVQRFGPDVRVETIDTGVDDLAALTLVIRLVAGLLLLMAGANLLTTLLTSNRESARRIGVQQALGFTPRQLVEGGAAAGATLGLVAVAVGVPIGLWLFAMLADVVSTSIGVGPGWMPMPSPVSVVLLVVVAVTVTAGLGALAVARLAGRPAADLVRWE